MKIALIVCCLFAVGLTGAEESKKVEKAVLHRIQLVSTKEVEVEQPKIESVPVKEVAEKLSEPKQAIIKFNRDTQACDNLCGRDYHKDDIHHEVCARGCRYFILSEVLTTDSDPFVKLNKSIENCSKSCEEGYLDGGKGHCVAGCYLAKSFSIGNLGSDSKKHDLSVSTTTTSTTTTTTPAGPVTNSDFNEMWQPLSRDPNQAFAENMLKLFNLFKERSHQMSNDIAMSMPPLPLTLDEGKNDSTTAGNANNEESGPLGGSFAVSRSMSIVVTKDAEGNRRIVVVHQPAKVFFGKSPFESDGTEEHMEADVLIPIKTIGQLGEAENEDESLSEGQEIELHPTGGSDSHWQVLRPWSNTDPSVRTFELEFRKANSWTRCMYALFLRVILLMSLLLVLYFMFWIFFTIPHRRRMLANARRSPAVVDARYLHRLYFLHNLKNKYVQLGVSGKLAASSPPPSYSEVETGAQLAKKEKPLEATQNP